MQQSSFFKLTIPPDTCFFLQQYFDQVLIVTVPRFLERQERVTQRLKGLDFKFFQGADKLNLDTSRAKRTNVYDEKVAQQLQRQGKPLNPGEIACSLSHRMVYEKMISEGWKRILILEDDVLPVYSILSFLPGALQELPDDWELVYLGFLKHEKVTLGLKLKQFFYKIGSGLGLMKWDIKMVGNLLPKSYSRYLKTAGFHDCTHAYAITLEAAGKLLAAQTPVVYRADDLLSSMIMKGKLKAFVTDPKFFDQEIFHDGSAGSEIKEALLI